MSEVEKFGWGCYWKLKTLNQATVELCEIIKTLEGGEEKLEKWIQIQKLKEEEREYKRTQRELKKIGLVKATN